MAPSASKPVSPVGSPTNASKSSNPNFSTSAAGKNNKPQQKQQHRQSTNPFFVAVSVFIIVAAFGVYRYLEPLEAFGPLPILEKYFADRGYTNKAIDITFQRTALTTKSGADGAAETEGAASSSSSSSQTAAGAAIDVRFPKVQMKKRVNAKDPILSIPRSEIIDLQHILKSEIAKLISYDNSSHIIALGDASFQTIFYYAYYMMYERRRGKESPIHGWIESLPKTFEHEGGALYWPDSVAHCLDRMASAEFIAIKSVVGITAQAANICCELPEEAVAGASVCEAIIKNKAEPFTEDEARWAISVYLRYNYNDQAIIPGLNFFKRSNKQEGVLAVQSAKQQTFDLVSIKTMEEGEEPVWNYNRGPGSSLVLFGFFDNTTDVAEFPFRLPKVQPDSLVYKMCHEHQHELLFTANGRPKEQLVRCMGAMLAQTNEQKKNLNNLRAREPLLLVDIYGNLTVVAHRHATSIVDASQSDQCAIDGMLPEHQDMVLAYMKYSNEFYNTITQYLFEETDRLCIAAKIPSRLRAPKAESEEEEGGAPSAGDAYDEYVNKAEEEVEDGTAQEHL